MKVVLASASERRQELLKRIVDDFHIIVSNFNEDEVKLKSSVSDYVKELSLGKAKDVADKVKEPSVIIGVDTIVTINNKILGKPKDKDDAFNMLSELSGNVHKVYSGIAIINTKTNEIMQDFLCTEVKFSTLTEEEIREYIESKEPLDKAGAYGIQGYGALLVEEIQGDYFNIVGLPISRLSDLLKKYFNINLFMEGDVSE